MNKRALYVVAGIVFVIAGALTYVLLMPSRGSITNQATTASPQPEPDKPPTGAQPGVYTDYSKQAVLTTKGTKLLFFYAPWCPQCRAIEASIKKSGIPNDVTVFKVDYDSNQELRQQYGVVIQTTFVKIDGQGNKIASFVAYKEPQFSSVKRELLQ